MCTNTSSSSTTVLALSYNPNVKEAWTGTYYREIIPEYHGLTLEEQLLEKEFEKFPFNEVRNICMSKSYWDYSGEKLLEMLKDRRRNAIVLVNN